MEEKKVINDNETGEVFGGREINVEEFSSLDPEKKKEYLRDIKKLNLKSGKIPRDLLNTVTGGDVKNGPLDSSDITMLDLFITAYKATGKSLERLIADLKSSGVSNNAINYVYAHWDSVQ